MDDNSRWMTYAELAEALGYKLASAQRLAYRRKWPRQVGNDGLARVAVPTESLAARRAERDTPGGTQDARDGDTPGATPGTSDEAATLRAAVARLEGEASGLRGQLEAAEAERQRLAADTAAARQEAAEARGQLQATEIARASAEARLQALEEEAERRRRSLLGRLLGW